ncbi:MAG: sensor histidine kinase [Rhizobiales bacterium]|nr:sensor histidine kinase [Hyphomicrobiales bacterium]
MNNLVRQSIYFCVIGIVVFGLGYIISHQYFSNQIYLNSTHQLQLYSKTLTSKLFELKPLNEVLSKNQEIFNALQNKQDIDQIGKTNTLLLVSKYIASASEIYLLDNDGTTIASSNWQRNDSFVGKNFKFRPYFKQAIHGMSGQFYAVGIESNIRGYYFSEPIKHKGNVIGVLVLKVAVDQLENIIKHSDHKFMILDNYGIVFLSNDKSFLYKKTRHISKEAQEYITRTKRFNNELIGELFIKPYNSVYKNNMVKMRLNGKKTVFLKTELAIPEIGWNFISLINEKKIIQPSLLVSFIAVFVILSLLFIFNTIRARIKSRSDKMDFINQQAIELEVRVEERTKELKNVQDEMVQTAKLAALGQMSAAISHELSQPLTSITNYSENARQYLDKKDFSKVQENISYIAKLSEKMGAIIHHTKIFASKRPSETEKVSVNKVIEETVWFMQSKFQRRDVPLEMRLPPLQVYILANSVRIEQVLMNLISNALESMQKSTVKILNIELTYNDDLVKIIIRDTGEGIDEEAIEKIFKPFYTTKENEHGMGIGLSISRSIIEEYDGMLKAFNRPTGGARFEIQLPINDK